MADTKISDLTAVTTPASTDEFAVNQGGTSKKQTRAQIHTLESGEHFVFPQVNEPATPTLAFGDGDTGFTEIVDDNLRVSIAGVSQVVFDITALSGTASANFFIYHSSALSSTVPVYSFVSDINTGLGHTAGDSVSLIAGGLEAIRAEDPADLGAAETSLWLYDDDNDTVEQVTVGIADSGGNGFKVLRIPN